MEKKKKRRKEEKKKRKKKKRKKNIHTQPPMLCDCAATFFERVTASTNETEADALFSQILDNKKDAVSIVLEALVRSLPNACAQVSGLRKLNRLISANPEARRAEVASKGGLEQVTTAMTVHSFHEGVQAEGSCALLWLVHENAPCQLLVTERGGVEAVVTAMGNFPANARVQVQGCSIIGNAAVHDRNIQRILRCGGVKAAVAAMARWQDDAQAQINGCVALGNIAENITGAQAVLMRGGVEAVVNSVRADLAAGGAGSDAARAEAGFYALCTLTASLATRRRVFECGGISAVIAAMGAHRGRAGIQSSGCVTLGNICVSTECRPVVLVEGGVEAIVAAMTGFPDDVGVQYSVCVALGLVTRNDGCRDAFIANAGVPALVAAMVRFKADSRILSYGCYTLGNVSRSLGGRRAALAAGALGVLIAALEAFPGNPVITADVCVTAELLLAGEAEHRRYCTPRVMEAFAAAARRSPRSRDLQAMLQSLRREIDPRAKQALDAALCSATFVPQCRAAACLLSQHGRFCTKCSCLQWTYLCVTCRKKFGTDLWFCETCWKHHFLDACSETHVAEKQFLCKRCSCEASACKLVSRHLVPPPCKIQKRVI